MDVHSVQAPALPAPALTREEMIAITAARPAALQQQSTAVAALRGSGAGEPAIDQDGHVDLYA